MALALPHKSLKLACGKLHEITIISFNYHPVKIWDISDKWENGNTG